MWQIAMTQPRVFYSPDVALEKQLAALIKIEIDLNSLQDYLYLCRVVIGYLFYTPEALQKEIKKLCNHEASPKRWIAAAVDDNQLIITDIEFAFNQLDSLVTGRSFWPQLLKLEPVIDKKTTTIN